MNEIERQLADLLVERDRARPRDMGPLSKQIAETEAALAAERAPVAVLDPAARYRAALFADAPTGDPCPACYELHESASAEADCVAESRRN